MHERGFPAITKKEKTLAVERIMDARVAGYRQSPLGVLSCASCPVLIAPASKAASAAATATTTASAFTNVSFAQVFDGDS